MRPLRNLCRNLLRRDRVERDLHDELSATLDLLADEKIRAGMAADEARRTARAELGAVEAIKDDVRDARAGGFIETLAQDVRHAFRGLRRSPLFAATAVLSLGIGIAGNALVFSLADAYLFRPRPGIGGADRLVEVGRVDSGEGGGFYGGDGFDTFSYANYLDYRARQTVFDGLAAYRAIATFGLGTGDTALRVPGSYVSANYFEVLRVPMVLGRGFRPEDEQLVSPSAVAVIAHDLWVQQFHRDRDVVGRTIRLNGRPFTIVGVAAPDFRGYTFDLQRIWVPVTAYPDGDDLGRVALRGRQWLMGVGRLKDGVTIEQAREEMSRIGRDLQREYPDDNRRHGVGVAPAGAVPVSLRPLVNRFVLLLATLVGLILLMACFNVAGMLLVRGVARANEIGLRLALGAARHRIIRLLITESVLLSGGGALAGLAAAWASLRLIERAIPLLRIPVTFDLAIDWRVAGFSIGLAAIAGTAAGLVPARVALRAGPAAALAATVGNGPRLRTRSVFVAAQVALSVLVVVCALLLGRSIRHAGLIDPGFAVDGLEVVGLDFGLGGYDSNRGRAFADQLMARIESLPGIEAVAAARVVPLTGEREGGRFWRPDESGDDRAIDASQNIVTPGYFRTLGLPLIAGRSFSASDRAGAPAVAIVNETLAARTWPGEPAVGRHFLVGVSRRPIEVVGVVRDSKYRTLGERPTPFFYVPAAQRFESTMWILMRPNRPSVLSQVQAIIRDMNPDLPVLQAATLSEMTAFTLFPQRLAAGLAALGGTIGLLLAALGVYGVTSYTVSRRTREIGIRIALGALRGEVLRLVARDALLLAATGTGLGLIAAAMITPALQGMLYGVRAFDFVSFAGGALILGGVVAVASLIAARKAGSVNPADALKVQ